MTRVGLLAALCIAATAAGCGDDGEVLPLTQVVLVVDTDLDIATELDEIEVFVTRPNGAVQQAVRLYSGGEQPPDTVTIVYDEGDLGPVRVSVVGRRLRTFVLLRELSFTFAEGASGVIRVDLLRECIGVTCSGDETCGAGGCTSESTTPVPWSGEGDPIDVVANPGS